MLMLGEPFKSSDKFVFLLGAGFSTRFGPPVMAAFMDRARRLYSELKKSARTPYILDHYDLTFSFYEHCRRGSGWALNRNWDNIEELYTQADLVRLANSGENRESPGDLCQSVAWSIWDVYRKCEVLNEGLGRILQKIQEELHLSPVIITTNYDVFIEKTILAAAPVWNYYYPGFDQPQGRDILCASDTPCPEDKTSVPIIKLHGSVNWFEINNHWIAVPPSHQPHAVDSDGFDMRAWADYLHGSLPKKGIDVDTTHKPVPAIIPPMLGKSSIKPVIVKQWNAAIKAIAGARRIWIIGYSFPSTDAFMPRLFAEAMQFNSDLEQLVICDFQPAEQWEERLQNLFVPTFRRNRVRFYSVTAHQILMTMHENACVSWHNQAKHKEQNLQANRDFM